MSTEPTLDGPIVDDALSHLGAERRRFLKRLAVGTAVAAPIVSSFSMSGMNAAYAQVVGLSGANMTFLCSVNGPYGPNSIGFGRAANQRPDLFGFNSTGICAAYSADWWTPRFT